MRKSKSEKIHLYEFHPITSEDLEWARKLHNDPSTLKMLTDQTHVTLDMQKRWYQSLRKSKTSKRLAVFYQGVKIGIVRIDNLDFANKSVCIGLDVVKKERGKGHGRKIYLALLDYFFNNLGMNRLWLFVAAYNDIAFSLYKKLGFKEEGRAREALYRFGKFNDYILMGMLKSEFSKVEAEKVNYTLSFT